MKYDFKKLRKVSGIMVACAAIFVVGFLMFSNSEDVYGANVGYTDHKHVWETPSKCGTCGGDNIVTTNCTKCYQSSGITYDHAQKGESFCYIYGCTNCGGNGWDMYRSPGQVSSACPWTPTNQVTHAHEGASSTYKVGTGKVSSSCSKCYASGTYKGKNTRCTKSGCSKGSYGAWSDYPNGVCYTTENQYTIAFHANGGSGSTTNLTGCYYDNVYTLTANGYTRAGYNFLGWSTSSTATTATYADKSSVSKLSATNGAKVILYAVWKANTYTISYDANGGSDAPDDTNFEFNSTTYISKNIPSRTGYTFDGWWAAHTTDTILLPGDEVPKGWGNFTLQARWLPNSYTMSFIPNGGNFRNSLGENIEVLTMTYDTKDFCDLSYAVIERKGYAFKGWYTQMEGGVQVYDAQNRAINEGTYFYNNIWRYAGDVTVYARWEGVPHTVTYNANGGMTPNREYVKYYEESLDLSLVAEKPGYIFVGWNTDPNAIAGLSSIKMQEEDITLYAIYSIDVSDIANHSYDENGIHRYNPLKTQEVFLRVWEYENEDNYQDYPLRYEYDCVTRVYRYVIDEDIFPFVKNIPVYGYAVYAFDNAGNWATLDTGVISDATPPTIVDIPDPNPEKYEQTVKHYSYDCTIGQYIHFATTVEEVLSGENYKPFYITPPAGYEAGQMTYPPGYIIGEDGTYLVTETATTKVYYEPIEYTLTFDANGGRTSINTKKVRYGDYYGEMPTPEREGHTFKGWFAQKDGGVQRISGDKYQIENDSTLFAHWSINRYEATYDYWTNGGTSAAAVSKEQDFDMPVDLSVIATKPGWTHVGWNTNPDAVTVLEEYRMPTEDVTLYAIYKKDITLIFMDEYPAQSRRMKTTIYNRQESQDVVIPGQTMMEGWSSNGWTTATEADAYAEYTEGGIYDLKDSITCYALYEKTVHLTYDSTEYVQVYPEVEGVRYYNASGTWKNPVFIVSDAPVQDKHAFVKWSVDGSAVSKEGEPIKDCMPGHEIYLESDVNLKAIWDAFPEIEAYDRYYTLEEASRGEITEKSLLEKVKGTDVEDGILKNGNSVIVKGYDESIFKNIKEDTSLEVTYQAMDSFGNTVDKTVIIHIVDTRMKESPRKSYVRFISRQFLEDEEGNLVPKGDGGLEDTSIWRTKADYLNLLRNVLYRTEVNAETWVFTREDIAEMKKSYDHWS